MHWDPVFISTITNVSSCLDGDTISCFAVFSSNGIVSSVTWLYKWSHSVTGLVFYFPYLEMFPCTHEGKLTTHCYCRCTDSPRLPPYDVKFSQENSTLGRMLVESILDVSSIRKNGTVQCIASNDVESTSSIYSFAINGIFCFIPGLRRSFGVLCSHCLTLSWEK